jgi:hydrogenase maturation protein HypF
VVRVQHHEAHAAACMAEHRYQGDALALALDGLGYGPDGTLWGGELLAGRPGRFERLGHLAQVPQPGGDRAAQEPWRMAASHLRRVHGARWAETPLPAFRQRDPRDLEILETLMERGVNAPLTSSCGRLFDAAAAILGFTGSLLYSAQAPMELESLAARCPAQARPYPCGEPVWKEERLLLDPAPLVAALAEAVLAQQDPREGALSFHLGLARLLALGARAAADRTGLRHVFLSGGCLQNAVLTNHLIEELRALDLTPHTHREVPPNDGGISFGQAAWALGAAQE